MIVQPKLSKKIPQSNTVKIVKVHVKLVVTKILVLNVNQAKNISTKMVPVKNHVLVVISEIPSLELVKNVTIPVELVTIKKILIVPLVKSHFIYPKINVLKTAQPENMKPLTVNVPQMMIVDVVENVTNIVKLVKVKVLMIVKNVLMDTSLNQTLTKNV